MEFTGKRLGHMITLKAVAIYTNNWLNVGLYKRYLCGLTLRDAGLSAEGFAFCSSVFVSSLLVTLSFTTGTSEPGVFGGADFRGAGSRS